MKKRLCNILIVLFIVLSAFFATTVFAVAEETENPTITIENTYAASGYEAEVEIRLKDNPGLSGAKLTLEYDDLLTLTSVTNGSVFSSLEYTSPESYSSPCDLIWNSESQVSEANGEIVKLRFRVAENAEPHQVLPVTLSYEEGDIVNGERENVALEIINGTITVLNFIPGDVNGDGEINVKDVILLRRFINGGYGVILEPQYRPVHTLTYVEEKESTCLEDGNTAYFHCETCGKYFTDEEGAQEIAYESTVIAKLEHTEESLPAKEATCTESGLTEGKKCSVCQTILVKQTLVPALGHSYEEIERKEKTCTEDGYILLRCSVCKEEKTQILLATGHVFGYDNVCDVCGYELLIHAHEYESQTIEPTCTSMGYTIYTCSSCGNSYKSDYIDARGHRWDEGEITVEPTCTQVGTIVYSCVRCDATYSKEVAISHIWKEERVEPTCFKDGYVVRTCENCGEVERGVLPAAHTWEEVEIIKEANCEEEGKNSVRCAVCGKVEEQTIPAKGHVFVNGVCTVCGKEFIEIVTPEDEHPEYGMFFLLDPITSNYGPETINEYGVLLYVNEGAVLDRVAVYLTQDNTMWRRCIAFTGENIEFAYYVPYLSYGTDILYTGLNSPYINTFELKKGADGIFRYDEYATIGVNLEDNQGNLLLSLYQIGQAGAKTRIFDNLSEMKAWLMGEDGVHTHTIVVDAEIPATCTKNGLSAGSHCSVCGEVILSRTIILAHHTLSLHAATSASCTVNGNTAYYSCSACGKFFADSEGKTEIEKDSWIIPSPGHSSGSTVIENEVKPTCTEDGSYDEVVYCTVCNEQISRTHKTVSKLDHNYVYTVKTQATCTTSGKAVYRCTRCNEETGNIYIPVRGHSYVSTVIQELTCTQDGIIKYTCTVCDNSYQVVTKAEHTYKISAQVAPTCTEEGYTEYTCSVCKATYRDVIPGGHNYVAEITKQATAKEDGVITYTCSKCGDSYEVGIPALGEKEQVEGSVLLIQDNLPWKDNTNVTLLNRLKEESVVTSWNITTATAASSVDFSEYSLVYIANDQTTATYNKLNALSTALADYVSNGGILVYGACDHGWSSGDISFSLVGGVTKQENHYSVYNYIVNDSHPIITAEMTDGKNLTNELLRGTYCSHTSFKADTLPEGATILLEDGHGNPTLVEYPYGEGTVIASGLTWEFYYVRLYSDMTNNYSKSVFDDMLVYALSLSNTCEHEYEEVETVAPTCTEKGYTKYVCTICEKVHKAEFVDALGHTWNAGEVTKEATCTQEGEILFTCTVCSETRTEVVEKLPHTLTKTSATSATCTVNGNSEYYFCSVCEKYFADSEGKTEIEKDSWIILASHSLTKTAAVAATCTAGGNSEYYFCSVCEKYFADDLAQTEISENSWLTEALDHELTKTEAVEATATSAGNSEYYTCSRCNKYFSDAQGNTEIAKDSWILPATGNAATYTIEGNYLYFGSYPQTEVTAASTKTALDSLAGTLPTSSNSGNWRSYGYYISGSVSNYMWYIDRSYGGDNYRGVYFTSYRPYWTTSSSSASNSNQDDNGYSTGTVYWFKYEPLKWRILTNSNGEAFVVCDSIIDSQQYYRSASSGTTRSRSAVANYNDAYYAGSGTTVSASVYDNNYLYSDVRAWLNETFYQTAFSAAEQALIKTTSVDNSVASTNPNNNSSEFNNGTNTYACANTQDKIFLLSEKEVTTLYNSTVGFSTSYSEYDTRRQLKNTDYAKSQGVYNNTSYGGTGSWWLRSPDYLNSRYARVVDGTGIASRTNYVSNSDSGVVPALKIRLTAEEHTHSLTKTAAVAATCTAGGNSEYYFCSVCEKYFADDLAQTEISENSWLTEALGHELTKTEAVEATATSAGNSEYYTCSRCNKYFSDAQGKTEIAKDSWIIPATGNAATYTIEGNYLYFGSYPQTEVTAASTKTALNSLAGTLPTSSNSGNWTSYGYYIEGSVSNYMWYIDRTYGGDNYRGVYFTSYRPYYTANSSSDSNSYQDDNGYSTGTVYWFKYEPLKWRILTNSNGEAFVVCDSIIDSQQYYRSANSGTTRSRSAVANYNDAYYAGSGTTVSASVYDNNYQYSDVRAWLNETFYQTAFSAAEQALIKTTSVDNSAASTNPNNNSSQFNNGTNTYACTNTQDKIFLLSEKEVTTLYNSTVGFSTSYSEYDTRRQLKNTDYAKSQGVWTSTSSSYAGNGWWWLRSPYYYSSHYARSVTHSGNAGSSGHVYSASAGVVPALKIRLTAEEHTHSLTKTAAVAATCTAGGNSEYYFCSVCEKYFADDLAQTEISENSWLTDALGHELTKTAAVEATATSAGNSEYYTCSRCNKYFSDAQGNTEIAKDSWIIPATGNAATYTIEGNYLYFGSYPQTEVTAASTKTALNSLAGTLPTSSNSGNWTSYGYYSSGSVSNYMWYIDRSYGGDNYRGVYFTSYRPYYTANSSSASNSYQDDNGYSTGTVYWFKYEPLKWRILTNTNGEAFVVCDSIIDSQQYYRSANSGTTRSRSAVANYNDAYYAGSGTTVSASVYDNNYLYSDVRAWLNETFYQTAFSAAEQALIKTTSVDNSAASTNPNNNSSQWNSGKNTYACANTQDKIFLLSEKEVTTLYNSTVGFSTTYNEEDTRRQLKNTDYAKSQGVWTSTSSSYAGNGYWWLRSPRDSNFSSARSVLINGDATYSSGVTTAGSGVVPALKIRLS